MPVKKIRSGKLPLLISCITHLLLIMAILYASTREIRLEPPSATAGSTLKSVMMFNSSASFPSAVKASDIPQKLTHSVATADASVTASFLPTPNTVSENMASLKVAEQKKENKQLPSHTVQNVPSNPEKKHSVSERKQQNKPLEKSNDPVAPQSLTVASTKLLSTRAELDTESDSGSLAKKSRAENDTATPDASLVNTAGKNIAQDRGSSGKPQPISRSLPMYPSRAQALRQQGEVRARFDINSAGRTENIRIIEAQPRNVFEQAVLQAIRQWRYQPHTASDISVTIIFNLNGQMALRTDN